MHHLRHIAESGKPYLDSRSQIEFARSKGFILVKKQSKYKLYAAFAVRNRPERFTMLRQATINI